MTEEQALKQLKQRDPEGLSWLIGRYTPYVSTVIWNIIGRCMTVQDLEELTSDVFLALWHNGDRPRPGKVKSYLGVIARNKALNKLRDRGVEPAGEDDLVGVAVGGPEGTVEAREMSRAVQSAVESLDWPDREIFIRYYYYCQPSAVIAGQMELSPEAVRQRLKRGRDKLRRYFQEGGIYDEADVL